MSKTIWKFPFKTADKIDLEMPVAAKVLSVQVQRGQTCIWALVDPTMSLKTRSFRIFGTGHPIDSLLGAHVGTYQLAGGDLVFHMFEVGGPV